jgi:hypothetical protein
MHLKRFLTAASIALLPLAASAATYIVPAAGTGPGANNSHWQSELTLHNLALRTLTVSVTYHDTNGPTEPVSVDIAPQATISIADVVKTKFGKESATGGLSINIADVDSKKLVVSSRTFNTSEAGEFGQDIATVNASDSAAPGDVDVLTAPSSAADYRFNFGVFAVSELRVQWELLRADGSVASARTETYGANTQHQYNLGVQTFFNVTPENNDAIRASVEAGHGIFYGSAVNQRTGDPTYVPGVRAREEIALNLGIDVGVDGRVDINDADHDGVLDTPLDVRPSFFPTTFRVVATNNSGVKPTFEILSTPSTENTRFTDDSGAVYFDPSSTDTKNGSEIRIRVTVGNESAILTIPITYRF